MLSEADNKYDTYISPSPIILPPDHPAAKHLKQAALMQTMAHNSGGTKISRDRSAAWANRLTKLIICYYFHKEMFKR